MLIENPTRKQKIAVIIKWSLIPHSLLHVYSIRGTGQKVFFGTDKGEGLLAQPVPRRYIAGES
jgi:hypothetical protein